MESELVTLISNLKINVKQVLIIFADGERVMVQSNTDIRECDLINSWVYALKMMQYETKYIMQVPNQSFDLSEGRYCSFRYARNIDELGTSLKYFSNHEDSALKSVATTILGKLVNTCNSKVTKKPRHIKYITFSYLNNSYRSTYDINKYGSYGDVVMNMSEILSEHFKGKKYFDYERNISSNNSLFYLIHPIYNERKSNGYRKTYIQLLDYPEEHAMLTLCVNPTAAELKEWVKQLITFFNHNNELQRKCFFTEKHFLNMVNNVLKGIDDNYSCIGLIKRVIHEAYSQMNNHS
jgi:hypothetical protein